MRPIGAISGCLGLLSFASLLGCSLIDDFDRFRVSDSDGGVSFDGPRADGAIDGGLRILELRSRNYPVSGVATAAASGDFNGDGTIDVVVAEGGVSVLLGAPEAQLGSAVHFDTGAVSQSVAVADFDGDRRLDLAVATVGGLSLLRGRSDGTFENPERTLLAAGDLQPAGIVAVDLDRNGQMDLVIANRLNLRSDNLIVLLGSGDGRFESPREYGAGLSTTSPVVADLTGDGVFDLAAVNENTNNLTLLRGKGDGSFESPTNFDAGTFPIGLAVADLNADQRVDLAIINRSATTQGGRILLNGGGDPMFSEAPFSAGGAPGGLAIGDLDRDGFPDLAVAVSQSLVVLLGTGRGGFDSSPRPFTADGAPNSVVTADLDGDGLLDVVTTNGDSRSITVLRNISH